MKITSKQLCSLFRQEDDFDLPLKKKKELNYLIKNATGLFFWQRRRREAAIALLSDLPLKQEEQRYLISRLKPIFRERLGTRTPFGGVKWFWRWLLPGCIVAVPAYINAWIASYSQTPYLEEIEDLRMPPPIFMLIFVAIYCTPLTLTIFWGLDGYRAMTLIPIIKILGVHGSIESIPLLAEAVLSRNVADVARQSLISILQNSLERKRLLASMSFGHLLRVLPYVDSPLALLILDSVNSAGYTQAIPTIRRLRSKWRTQPLRGRAEETLAYLLILSEAEEEKTHLLRAFTETDSETVLLRPSYTTASEPEEQLLRASQHPDE
jgi:hypothetical protein